MISYRNTTTEVGKVGAEIAILPIGSVEQHSSHLPIGTDYYVAKAVSEAVAEKMNALLFPTIPFSTCYEHRGTKGSVCMRPTTFYHLVQDLVMSLYDQGIKKVVLILGHGGIFVAGPAVRELNALHEDLKVLVLNPDDKDCEDILETSNDLHAGESETSLMLYIKEELVKKDLMMQNDYIPDCPREYLNYTTIPKVSKTGVWGKSSLATKEKGKQLFERRVNYYVEYIKCAFEYTTKEKNWNE